MATTVRKGLMGKEDLYLGSSLIFNRTTSVGGNQTLHRMGATYLPTQNAKGYFSASNVERGLRETWEGRLAVSASLTTRGNQLSASLMTRGNQLSASINNLPVFPYRRPPFYAASISYAATLGVSQSVPSGQYSDVWINGSRYRNSVTSYCTLNRTARVTATGYIWGGIDRGPAATGKAYYLYAVPLSSPTATRGWRLIASDWSPTYGPKAAATYANWSYLGAVMMTYSPGAPTVPFLKNFSRTQDSVRLPLVGLPATEGNLSYTTAASCWQKMSFNHAPTASVLTALDLRLFRHRTGGAATVNGWVTFAWVNTHRSSHASSNYEQWQTLGKFDITADNETKHMIPIFGNSATLCFHKLDAGSFPGGHIPTGLTYNLFVEGWTEAVEKFK